jgi:hypothetical protein
MIADQPHQLFACRTSAPAQSDSEIESRLHRVAVGFRGNLNLGQFLQIEPLASIW